MSKANHALNTSERAAPSRRALLCTAPVALAAALPEIPLLGPLVPAAVASQRPSRLFLEYQKRRAKWLAAYDDPCPAFGSAEEAALEVLTTELNKPVWDAIDAIMERTPQSWNDVIELARVIHDELWDENGQHSLNDDIEASLVTTVLHMAEGGAHV